MAIFNPIKRQMQRVVEFTRPPGELTGDAVSRAAAQIEKELGDETVGLAPPLPVTIDEVRIYASGTEVARMSVGPVVMRAGDSFRLDNITISMT